jgi:hypothetical protein
LESRQPAIIRAANKPPVAYEPVHLHRSTLIDSPLSWHMPTQKVFAALETLARFMLSEIAQRPIGARK